jgi:plastocyanin
LLRAHAADAGHILAQGALTVRPALMDDFFFTPNRIQVPVGTTVSWQNNGAAVPTATEPKGAWDTGDINPGETKLVTFDTPGTYAHDCSSHAWMIAQVIVQ